MDRFIDVRTETLLILRFSLKSNMDRFIALGLVLNKKDKNL